MSSLPCRNKYLVLALKKVCKNRYKSFPVLPHFALFFTFSQNIFHRIVAFLHKLSKWQDIKTRGTPYFFLEKNHSEKIYRECHFDPVLLSRLAQNLSSNCHSFLSSTSSSLLSELTSSNSSFPSSSLLGQ